MKSLEEDNQNLIDIRSKNDGICNCTGLVITKYICNPKNSPMAKMKLLKIENELLLTYVAGMVKAECILFQTNLRTML